MKALSLDGLTLPTDITTFPPITEKDRELIVQAVGKECGEAAKQRVAEIVLENARAAHSAHPETVDLVLDFVNDKGRWVRTFFVGLGEMRREDVQALLKKPVEVKEFAFVTPDDLPKVRVFQPHEKTPLQQGGSGVPEGDVAGFNDDCQALKKVLGGA